MTGWQNIVGHDQLALDFARAEARGRLGGSFLFVGPPGIGKRTFAFALAKTLLCLKRNESASTAKRESISFRTPDDLTSFQPCNECESCRLFDTVLRSMVELSTSLTTGAISPTPQEPAPKKGGSKGIIKTETQEDTLARHPDFHYVYKEPEKKEIPLELLVGGNREGLCSELYRKPFFGLRKIAVIDDADCFNQEGANALLKTLEEPPERSLIFLIGTSTSKQLPTIRSRCQIFRFHSLPYREMAELLLRQGRVESLQQGIAIAQEAEGAMAQVDTMEDATTAEFRSRLFRVLSGGPVPAIPLATLLLAFMEEQGKVLALQRNRIRLVLVQMAGFYRTLLRFRETGKLDNVPLSVQTFYQQASNNWREDSLALATCAERTLKAMEQIDAMGTPSLVIESLTHDLARLTTGRQY